MLAEGDTLFTNRSYLQNSRYIFKQLMHRVFVRVRPSIFV